MKTAVVLIGAALLLLLVGCKSTLEEAEAEFCHNLANFQAAVDALENVYGNTSIDEAKRARDDAVKAYENLVESAEEVQELKLDAVAGAVDNLKNEVQSIPGSTELSDAADLVQEAAKETRIEVLKIYATVCD